MNDTLRDILDAEPTRIEFERLLNSGGASALGLDVVALESMKPGEVMLIPKLRGPLLPGETALDALRREIKERPEACAVIRGIEI